MDFTCKYSDSNLPNLNAIAVWFGNFITLSLDPTCITLSSKNIYVLENNLPSEIYACERNEIDLTRISYHVDVWIRFRSKLDPRNISSWYRERFFFDYYDAKNFKNDG